MQAIMVDPVYEVNPLTALVDLLTKLILLPLSRWDWFLLQDMLFLCQFLERPFWCHNKNNVQLNVHSKHFLLLKVRLCNCVSLETLCSVQCSFEICISSNL